MNIPDKGLKIAQTGIPVIHNELDLPSLGAVQGDRSGPRSLFLALPVIFAVLLAGMCLCAPAAFAADEICASCGRQVSISGNFAHRKDSASVTIEGTADNATAFREEINGKHFAVSIANLPAGKYTVVIGEAETLASAPGERLFDVTSGDVTLATNFDIVAAAGARKVCYITGAIEHEDDSIGGPLTVAFEARTNTAKFNTFELKDASGASVIAFNASELAEPFSAAAVRIPEINEPPIWKDPMFRHDKPQAGRVREHHQFGCEVLGDGDPAIDAEMIALLYDFYAHLGLKHIRVFINSIGDGNCRPQYIEILKDYYRPLLADCCQDCQVRFNKNPLRLLDCKEPQDQPKIAAAPKISDYLCEPCREHFDAVKRFLSIYEVPFEHDPLIVRGLDYYTRTVFEFTSDIDKLALNGGGRYDGLAEILGGAHTPGIGFGAGIERTILEMKRQKVTPPVEECPMAFVVYLGKSPEYKDAAIRYCSSFASQLHQGRNGIWRAQPKIPNEAGR